MYTRPLLPIGISLFFICVNISLFFVFTPSVYGDYELESIYRMSYVFPVGAEDREGCYCPLTQSVYLFGGDISGGGTSIRDDIYEWEVTTRGNPVHVGDLTQSVCKAGAVWDSVNELCYIYGGRIYGDNYYDKIQWFDPVLHTDGVVAGITLPGGGLGCSRTVQYSPIQESSYLIVGRTETTDYPTDAYIYKHNVSANTFTSTGENLGWGYWASGYSAYVDFQDSIYFFGGRGYGWGEDTASHAKYVWRFDCGTETVTNISGYVWTDIPMPLEGAMCFYNTDDQLIYVCGGNDNYANPDNYHDDIWSFNPSNYTTGNPVVMQDVVMNSCQDDACGVYDGSYGYLLGMTSDKTGTGNDPTQQIHIDQLNFTLSVGVYNTPVLQSIGYINSGCLGSQNVTVGNFWINWTYDASMTYLPSSHLIEIANDTGFTNIVMHYNASQSFVNTNDIAGYANYTCANLSYTLYKRYIRVTVYYET